MSFADLVKNKAKKEAQSNSDRIKAMKNEFKELTTEYQTEFGDPFKKITNMINTIEQNDPDGYNKLIKKFGVQNSTLTLKVFSNFENIPDNSIGVITDEGDFYYMINGKFKFSDNFYEDRLVWSSLLFETFKTFKNCFTMHANDFIRSINKYINLVYGDID